MNSRVTLSLAGLLMIGAMAAGYWGVYLSRAPQPAAPGQVPGTATTTGEQVEQALSAPVVVLIRPLKAFTPVVAEDLAIEHVRNVPPGSFGSPDKVVGRTAWVDLPTGSWLNESSFATGSSLAQMIRPGERAVAVAVDEVTVAGHHLRPGDYVDVLLFLAGDALHADSAQVVLPSMRLLGIGPVLGLKNDGQPANPATSAEDGIVRQTAHSAVLAVPEAQVTRLLLASQSGLLRLAVRSADEKLLAQYMSSDGVPEVAQDEAQRRLVQIDQLAAAARVPAVPLAAAVRPATGPAPRAQAGNGIEVIRGSESNRNTP
ncbi:Flp pilus assembly protein CpaB [Pseudomonas sp. LRF_L74]|uniref:Flp pilus assembly protein CpaB n=1 Tax=Pseudomonas sp. LRF_L74 TaxID=3369422 RepID=UPI003F62BF74